jgi:hypothetical protein
LRPPSVVTSFLSVVCEAAEVEIKFAVCCFGEEPYKTSLNKVFKLKGQKRAAHAPNLSLMQFLLANISCSFGLAMYLITTSMLHFDIGNAFDLTTKERKCKVNVRLEIKLRMSNLPFATLILVAETAHRGFVACGQLQKKTAKKCH